MSVSWGADPVVEGGDLLLDVLARLGADDVAAVLGGEGVEEDGVHVVADAEDEEAGVGGRGGADVLEDTLAALLADGGKAVREEDQGRLALAIHEAEAGEERLVDVGAALGAEAVDVGEGGVSRRRGAGPGRSGGRRWRSRRR
jgi:hypothetical protein